ISAAVNAMPAHVAASAAMRSVRRIAASDALDARAARAAQHLHAVAGPQLGRPVLYHGDGRAVVEVHGDLLRLVVRHAMLDRVAGKSATDRAEDRGHAAARAVADLAAENAADRRAGDGADRRAV